MRRVKTTRGQQMNEWFWGSCWELWGWGGLNNKRFGQTVGGRIIKMHYPVHVRSNSIGLGTSCFAQKAISRKEWGWGHPFGITWWGVGVGGLSAGVVTLNPVSACLLVPLFSFFCHFNIRYGSAENCTFYHERQSAVMFSNQCGF